MLKRCIRDPCFDLALLISVHVLLITVHALQEEAQGATDALEPPHRWVPWVTVAGAPINARALGEASHVARRVCDAYQGPRYAPSSPSCNV